MGCLRDKGYVYEDFPVRLKFLFHSLEIRFTRINDMHLSILVTLLQYHSWFKSM